MKCIVEISDDGKRVDGTDFFIGITDCLDEFIVLRCHLILEDIAYIFFRGVSKGFRCMFSENTFITKNFQVIDELERYLNKTELYRDCVGLLDLRNCNFSIEEKESLKNKLRHYNLLI